MAQPHAEPVTDDDDTYIGERVHMEMWRAGITQVQLAAALGLDQAAVSRRLRGRTAWKASEVRRAANLLRVAVVDLLPPDELTAAALKPQVSGVHGSNPSFALPRVIGHLRLVG